MMQPPQNQSPDNLPPEMQSQEEVHLSDYLAVLYRRRKIALWAFFAVAAGVALYTFLAAPVYEAAATLHVDDEKARGNLMSELGLERESPIETEIEILKARTNIEEVVERLNLNWRTREDAGIDVRVADFASKAEEPVYRIELTGDRTYRVAQESGEVLGEGRSGELFRKAGLTLLLKDLQGPENGEFELALAPFQETVRRLREEVQASEVGKGTSIIRIAYRDTDPELAKEVVNTLARVYLERSVKLKTEEASRSVEFITAQLEDVRSLLDSAEENLESFKRDAGVVQLDTEAEALIERLSEMEKSRAQLALRRRQADFAVDSLRQAIESGKVYAPAVLTEQPVVAALGQKLAELQVEKRALESELTPQHPEVRAVSQQIAETQKKLLGTYRTTRAGLREQIAALEEDLAGYEKQLGKLPAAERRLARLTRLADVNAEIYTFLLQKHEEARIAKAATISNVNIIDPAIAPDQPVKPQKKKNLLLGLIVGGMFGVGLAFFREYMDDSVKDAEVAKGLFGLAVLATIPHIRTPGGKRGGGNGASSKERALVAWEEPKSQAAEAFRSLRTALHFTGGDGRRQVLLVSSTLPGEGKTTVSANLAETMAQTGSRVLLIGCDLRKPTLHQLFDAPRTPGLTEYLVGDAEVGEILRDTERESLHVINAGTVPPSPAELLGSERMRQLIDTLRERYDHILLDAPPFMAVTDASLLVPLCDQVAVVMEAGAVQIKAARRMREILEQIQAPAAGLVVNDKTGRGAEYYGSYGARYGYGYGYGYYGEETGRQKKGVLGWFRKS